MTAGQGDARAASEGEQPLSYLDLAELVVKQEAELAALRPLGAVVARFGRARIAWAKVGGWFTAEADAAHHELVNAQREVEALALAHATPDGEVRGE